MSAGDNDEPHVEQDRWEAEREAELRHLERSRKFRDKFENGSPHGGVRDELLAGNKKAVLRDVLLDDSTLDHAFRFSVCTDSEGFDRVLLTENRHVVRHALTSLIEALVLHDRIAVGAHRELAPAKSGGISGLGIEVTEAENCSSPASRFWMLSAARRGSLKALAEIPELADVLANVVGEELNLDQLRSNVERITVSGSGRSIHKIQHLIERDGFYLKDMSDTLEARLHSATIGQRGADVLDEADSAINITMDQFQHVPRKGVGSFFAAYIIVRAMFYLLVADYLGCTYRGDYVRSAAVRTILGSAARRAFIQRVLEELEIAEGRRDEEVNRALGYKAFSVTMPLVANAILQRAQTRRECITIALEVRESRQARRFRQYCSTVDDAIHQGDRRRVERVLTELGRYGVRLTESITPASSPDVYVTPIKELASFASPLAGALVSAFGIPVAKLSLHIRSRKFALLDEMRAAKRSSASAQGFDELWATLPPSPSSSEWPRARDFRLRRGR